MGLVKKWDIERTWGSHQAVLKATLEVLKPQSAIECGCGYYSTPFMQTIPRLTTIEHDIRWAKKIQSEFPGHEWVIKEFMAKNPTRISELAEGEFEKICTYYENLSKRLYPCDLLFVDTFTACRIPAVLYLGRIAETIIIHDLEPPGPEVYEWHRLDEFLKDWNKYIHKPMGHVGNGHQIPWTGLYSMDELSLPLDELNEAMKPESMRLWNSFTPLIQE
jgi:hypothetical protein